MRMEPAEGMSSTDAVPVHLPHFDVFVRRLGDIDSPEIMAWWANPDWRGCVVLAVVTPRGSARVLSACVVLGEGRPVMPERGREVAGVRRARLRREIERQRSTSRSAIDRAFGELASYPQGATFHVTSAFALRTVRAHLDAGGGRAGGTGHLEAGVPRSEGGEATTRIPGGSTDAGARRARAIDWLADNLSTWLEREYHHDDWRPDDTSQAALSHALAVMVAEHNDELDEPASPSHARNLPAPRSSSGGSPGARPRPRDRHAMTVAALPGEPTP